MFESGLEAIIVTGDFLYASAGAEAFFELRHKAFCFGFFEI